MIDSRIPIANIYYLLCYAWNHSKESDLVSAGELDELNSVQELYGKILATGTFLLVRRGIDRGYLDFREDLAGVRGKINLAETTKRALRARGRVSCDFQELSHDILHNQILRSTLYSLMRVRPLDRQIASDVRNAYTKLEGIREISLARQVFHQVQLDRNRRYYRLLLSVCRLIHEQLLVDEQAGSAIFSEFTPERLYQLYEDFIINFFRREQKTFKVNNPTRTISWSDTCTPIHHRSKLPRMEADVILEAPERRIIMDAKFYENTLGGRFGGKIQSAHLYQLLAYLRNREATVVPGPRHEGILLYPTVGTPVSIDVQLEGFLIKVRNIDLSQDWRKIHDAMLGFIA